MTWTQALGVKDLAPGTRQVVKLGGRSLLLLNESGTIHAVNNICPHLKFPLKKGKVTADGSLVCPLHRSEFDLATGNVNQWCPFPPVVGNVLGKISSPKNLTVYPTKLEGDQIFVDLN